MSAWTISIVTAIFSLILTIAYDYFKKIPILTTVWLVIKWTGDTIWMLLDFNIKVWWLLLSIACLILIIKIFNKPKKEETILPDFYKYTEDKFRKWKWKWRFDQERKAWLISDLTAICPHCDTPMTNHSNMYGISYSCPRCDFNPKNEQCDEAYKVERIILDNIDRRRASKQFD